MKDELEQHLIEIEANTETETKNYINNKKTNGQK